MTWQTFDSEESFANLAILRSCLHSASTPWCFTSFDFNQQIHHRHKLSAYFSQVRPWHHPNLPHSASPPTSCTREWGLSGEPNKNDAALLPTTTSAPPIPTSGIQCMDGGKKCTILCSNNPPKLPCQAHLSHLWQSLYPILTPKQLRGDYDRTIWRNLQANMFWIILNLLFINYYCFYCPHRLNPVSTS